jgi:hypothetical protein
MNRKHVAALAGARLHTASKAPAMVSSGRQKVNEVNCNICAMPEASFTSGWYRPERPMSHSERLKT